jgi:acetyl esterase/lipase
MIDRVDERGKVFTPRIRKVSVEVEVFAIDGRIHGYMHVAPDQRVKDLLNSPDEYFLAVTDATIMRDGESEARKANFVAVNKNHVISVIPINEPRPIPSEDGYQIP